MSTIGGRMGSRRTTAAPARGFDARLAALEQAAGALSGLSPEYAPAPELVGVAIRAIAAGGAGVDLTAPQHAAMRAWAEQGRVRDPRWAEWMSQAEAGYTLDDLRGSLAQLEGGDQLAGLH